MSDDGNNGDQGRENPYFWWEGSDLYEFFATVSKSGYDNVRIEVREEEGDDGPEAFLDVINLETGELIGHYNFSHSCPPACD